MTSPGVYLLLPGLATEALQHCRSVFGGEVEVHSYAEFGRTDGPGEAVAHGALRGPVDLFVADAGADEDAVAMSGTMLALLGVGDPATSRTWFDALGLGGRVTEPLQRRPWGAWDGQLVDRYGVRWLIGFEAESAQG